MRGYPKFKWNRWGKYWVYEGDYGIAVGNKEMGYSVFASKSKVKIRVRRGRKEAEVTYLQESGFSGTYETRGRAKELVVTIDKTLSKEGLAVIKVSGGPEDVEAFTQVNPKTGGSVAFYQEGDLEGYIHEKSHYLLGHLGKGAKKKSLKREKEAVELQIRMLKVDRKYTPEMRKSIIGHLSTYYRGKDNLKRAEKFVSEAEVVK